MLSRLIPLSVPNQFLTTFRVRFTPYPSLRFRNFLAVHRMDLEPETTLAMVDALVNKKVATALTTAAMIAIVRLSNVSLDPVPTHSFWLWGVSPELRLSV